MHSFYDTIPEFIVSRFCIAGINYRNTAAAERSLFAMTRLGYAALLRHAGEKGFRSIFALSTCNRSELYGYCQHDSELVDLFLQHTKGTAALFRQHGFVKRGNEALNYLFRVAAGLDSQITGDYEILGQLKTAVSEARQYGLIGPIMDRTVNFALQASKAIKTHTRLSNGTVSVSYAAIEWLKRVEDISGKRILVYGAGSLGKSVVKNLRHYLQAKQIALVNRTDEKAAELAGETGLNWVPYERLAAETAISDIIIVCTAADGFTILPSFFPGSKKQYVLDLSVPENVHPAVRGLAAVTVAGVDEVSQKVQETFAKRNAEIPRATLILEQHLGEFHNWLALHRHVPAINDIKSKLHELSNLHCCTADATGMDSRIDKTIGRLAINLRYKREKGCQYINAINDFLQPLFPG